MKPFYRVEELAEMLSVSKETIWRWGREGKIGVYRIGRTCRYYLKEEGANNDRV